MTIKHGTGRQIFVFSVTHLGLDQLSTVDDEATSHYFSLHVIFQAKRRKITRQEIF